MSIAYDSFKVHGPHEKLLALLAALEHSLPDDWSRRSEFERHSDDYPYHGPHRCFACSATKDRPHAASFLVFTAHDVLFLANIVPLGKLPDGEYRLSPAAYGRVLDELLELHVRPCAGSLGLRVVRESGPVPVQ